jgi:hypothetical protein
MATVDAVISITPSFEALAGAHASIVTPQRPTRFVRIAISGGAIGAGAGSILGAEAGAAVSLAGAGEHAAASRITPLARMFFIG